MKYKRILLKLSGESLMGNQSYGFDDQVLLSYANDIKEVAEMGVEIGVVIGGGNIFRGMRGTARGIDRVKGDQMGMLATVVNSIALQSVLEGIGQPATVLTAIRMEPVGIGFSKARALECLRAGTVAIIGGGTGNPYFTTDTASALRAIEIEADVLLKGTRVDGVYSSDPEKNPDAVRYESLSFEEAYEKELKIMDLTAFTLCLENRMPILVFDMNVPGNLKRALLDSSTGTLVHP